MSDPAPSTAASSFPAPQVSLPCGLEVLRTYSGALICLEIGWVMFVSLLTFLVSSTYLTLLLSGLADRIEMDWNVLAATTAANGGAHIQNGTDTMICITYPRGNVFTILDQQQYSINVAATIFSFVVTLCYACSLFMGFKRWRRV
ncbi:hypothetical protein CRUP_010584 [Coryphaenoides rupestris]|nr:hypothetical protein CRUP_010584 [Coryphaenoides rupestris]